MQQSHHQGIFPGSTRFAPVQSLPVRPVLSPVQQKYICSPIITVHYGLHQSTHVNTWFNKSGSSQWTPVSSRWIPGSSRWTPGSSRSTYGGHPVHPGQHTVHPGQHTVHYGSSRSTHSSSRSTHGSLRFITVHYGSLRCLTVHYGSSRSTHGSLWLITVHYGALRFIMRIVTIPVNTRFITVHYGSSRPTPSSSRSTPGLNFLPGSMPVRPNYQTCLIFYAAVPPSRYFPRFNPVNPVPEFAGSSRYCPRFAKIYLQSHHHGSLRFAPVDTRQHPV